MQSQLEIRDSVLEMLDSDGDDHLLCCSLLDDFVGFTTTLCGKLIFVEELVDVEDDDDPVSCVVCASKSGKGHCPIGRDCTQGKPCTR